MLQSLSSQEKNYPLTNGAGMIEAMRETVSDEEPFVIDRMSTEMKTTGRHSTSPMYMYIRKM